MTNNHFLFYTSEIQALVCLAPPSGQTPYTTSHLPFTELALLYSWIVQLLSRN